MSRCFGCTTNEHRLPHTQHLEQEEVLKWIFGERFCDSLTTRDEPGGLCCRADSSVTVDGENAAETPMGE
jgi:hypothetical protein